ncbi:hypothetical protein GZL_03550 [Streptomyces sp. 769]|nr:hypothetical protein GZL_03550 [Streptomyces sp. 769]
MPRAQRGPERGRTRRQRAVRPQSGRRSARGLLTAVR